MMLDAFKNPPQTREEGIYFDDQQYKCVRADKNSIYGKCVSIHLQAPLCAEICTKRMITFNLSQTWVFQNFNFLNFQYQIILFLMGELSHMKIMYVSYALSKSILDETVLLV